MATGFLTTALYLGLVGRLGLPWAALVTGTVLALVAALLLLWARLLVLRPQASPSEIPEKLGSQPSAGQLGEVLGEEAATWTKQHPGGALIAALVVGFVVGSSPKLRARLLDLLR